MVPISLSKDEEDEELLEDEDLWEDEEDKNLRRMRICGRMRRMRS